MNPALSGLYAVTPDPADTAVLPAIGGITLGNAAKLINARADAIAVISALFAALDVGAAARRFCPLFRVKAV